MTLERVQILLSHEQRQKLKELAQKRGSSVSELTRQAIDSGLEQLSRNEHQKQMQKALQAARRLRESMPLLTVDVTADLRQIREERDEQISRSH